LSLHLQLDLPLPESLPTGAATALFVVGSCFHPTERIEHLLIVVDGVSYPAAAFGLPRPDVAAAHPTCPRNSFFSGFWGTAPVPERSDPGPVEASLAAVLESGHRDEIPLRTIAFTDPGERCRPQPSRQAEGDPLPQPGEIAICMATFEPDERLFRTQIESLRAQTDQNWSCVISDDGSSTEHFEKIVEVVGDDRRFTISRSPTRLFPYRNFERSLELVPEGATLVALCDQDDRWYPEKLRTLRGAIGDGLLVYSDMRLVEADGRILRETMWRGRRNNHDDLVSMLVANSITGASAMFRPELLDLALPFPDPPGFQFHDHWLALIALAAGRVKYVDRPLYDYVQHPGAVFGHVTHGVRPGIRTRLSGLKQLQSVPRWRAGYFYGYLSREVQAEVALLRCADRLSSRKRRALELFIASDSSLLALFWLACRPFRRLIGRTETLGTELELAQGLAWKRLIVLRARYWPYQRGRLSDASIPPPESFVQKRLRRWRARI
jgi:glycosyltransferase involved in cell wall biosynthesis